MADRDTGMSLIEVLVALVLLGTVVIATLTALRVSIDGSAVERDHARAHQWLQSATGVLQAGQRASCASNEATMRSHYQDLLRDNTPTPVGWGDWQIAVVHPIRVWDGSRYWDPTDSATPATCFEPLYQLQLINIRVVSPDGRIIETREVVKGG